MSAQETTRQSDTLFIELLSRLEAQLQCYRDYCSILEQAEALLPAGNAEKLSSIRALEREHIGMIVNNDTAYRKLEQAASLSPPLVRALEKKKTELHFLHQKALDKNESVKNRAVKSLQETGDELASVRKTLRLIRSNRQGTNSEPQFIDIQS